jgi:hypothetical protein
MVAHYHSRRRGLCRAARHAITDAQAHARSHDDAHKLTSCYAVVGIVACDLPD